MRYLIIAVLLCTPWTVAMGQDAGVNVRLQDGDSILGTSWFFAYSCVIASRDNPGWGVRRTWQSQDLRLDVDGKERLIPAKLLASIHFDWKTASSGWLTRGRARFSLTTGETIEQWSLHREECGLSTIELTLVLPPEGKRRDFVRIDLWTTMGGEPSAFDRKEKVIEIRFRTAAIR
jgi:hypothetical protein